MRKNRFKIGDKVQVALEGELTAYDDELGLFTLRGHSVPDGHVPWDYTLHWSTTFTPVEEPAAVDADVPKLEKLAAWLDFQFGAPGVGNQVRSFSGALIAARAERDEYAARLIADFPEIVGVSEAAEILGVSRQRVDQLASHENFPKSVATLRATRVWLRDDVVKYGSTRKRSPGPEQATCGHDGVTWPHRYFVDGDPFDCPGPSPAGAPPPETTEKR